MWNKIKSLFGFKPTKAEAKSSEALKKILEKPNETPEERKWRVKMNKKLRDSKNS